MESGLNFSGFESNYAKKKSNFRKAGDAFSGNGNSTSNNSSVNNSSSKPSAYDQWMSAMGSQSSNNTSTQTQTQSTNNSQVSTNTPESPSNAPKPGKPPAPPAEVNPSASSTAEDGWSPQKNGQSVRPVVTSTPTDNKTAGQKFAENVRPEYAEQAATLYDSVHSMNHLSDKTKGNIMTHMGGDALLPDPKKVEARLKQTYANRPELLSNILTYMT